MMPGWFMAVLAALFGCWAVLRMYESATLRDALEALAAWLREVRRGSYTAIAGGIILGAFAVSMVIAGGEKPEPPPGPPTVLNAIRLRIWRERMEVGVLSGGGTVTNAVLRGGWDVKTDGVSEGE